MNAPHLNSLSKYDSLKRWIFNAFVCTSLLIVLPVMLGYATSGKSTAEKMATAATQPLFVILVALAIAGMVAWQSGRRKTGMIAFSIVATVWFLAADVIGGRLVRAWEAQIPIKEWSQLEPFDYVVVLGGGTGKRPDGTPQSVLSGDRVVTAARLFHRGIAKHLITTGDFLKIGRSFQGNFEDVDRPSTQTVVLWRELGIPSDFISTLGGQNTSSEMNELATHPEWWEGKRCAVVTSAFHMPRAIKLAQQRKIPLEPIPCDYRGRMRPLTLLDFFPDQEVLLNVHSCFKEWLGMRLSR